MWDCWWAPGSGWGSGYMWGGGLFSMLFWGVIIILLILLGAKLVHMLRPKNGGGVDREHSLRILQERFASGEIQREEYMHMKETLMS